MRSRSRASLYGDGLFETMRLRRGSIPLWPWHARRMHAGSLRLGLDVPRSYLDFEKKTFPLLRKEIVDLDCSFDYRIRLDIVRSGGGSYFPAEDGVKFEIDIRRLTSDSWGQLPEETIWIDTSTAISGYGALSPYKTISAANYVCAANQSVRWGYRYSILTTNDGSWVEGISSCLLFKLGTTWYVPSLVLGGVSGVFRAWAVRQLTNWRIPIRYSWNGPFSPHNLEAVMLGNALQGAWAVHSIEKAGQRIEYPIDPVVYQLNAALENLSQF